MNKYRFVAPALAGAGILGLSFSAGATDAPAPAEHAMHHAAAAEAKPAPTDEELIASAMKAAPKKVADNATIVAPGDKGAMRTLRTGTNGFTCMPDNPETPPVPRAPWRSGM